MKKYKPYLAIALILPILTLPFLGRSTFKRFYPSVLFICSIVLLESIVAYKRVWWWFYNKIMPKPISDMFLIIAGPFFVGSLWILKFTYGKFKRYLAINFIIDTIFVYIIINLFKKIGYGSLVRIKRYQFLSLFLLKAILLYMFQFVREKRGTVLR
ncbi:hypothetical protein M3685_22485 [Heyndrickxia oleronia]|uniref:hypothetical protein n=1 Tax=Heyndrickxia oleronia TaxID=38875 RepID=UPI002041D64B|nr:hypothetical protein [Heyndrickxia oleronia]MCM3456671.1 hypothetical protein [Heyndrickxia oleronia]